MAHKKLDRQTQGKHQDTQPENQALIEFRKHKFYLPVRLRAIPYSLIPNTPEHEMCNALTKLRTPLILSSVSR